MSKREDLTGKTFSRLTVRSCAGYNNGTYWVCDCSCGGSCTVLASSLKGGRTQSCGCYRKDLLTLRNESHGKRRYPEYAIWNSMRQRCQNTRDRAYPRYGGRGVVVCSEWDSFEKFYNDMGPRPSSDHSLDRIDNSGNYCKENCRWATIKEQNNNQRKNIFLMHNGETFTISQWSESCGIAYSTLYGRLSHGWSTEDALTRPVQKRGQK